MSNGPIALFDKSFLQSLSVDEAVWFQNFYRANITPLFFVETLADLDKEVAAGRTPEQVVGNLAYKTPRLGAMPNMGHLQLCTGDLLGRRVEMRRVPIIPGGRTVMAGGKAATVYDQPPEINAMQRWQRGEFEAIEREFARDYRASLRTLDLTAVEKKLRNPDGSKLRFGNLAEVKTWAEARIRAPGRRYETLRNGLEILGIPERFHAEIMRRWKQEGGPLVSDFAPYAAYVLTVDFFFYAALASGHIAATRASNRIDMAYLYYAPFCMVFTSCDRLHARTVPLFLGKDQAFVPGGALKADLGKLDAHYSALPPETQLQGVMRFASDPPIDGDYLTSSLWDQFLPGWRKRASNKIPITPETNARIIEQMRPLMDAAKQSTLPNYEPEGADERVMFTRNVFAKVGKWHIVPPEATKADNEKREAEARTPSLTIRNRTLLRAANEIFGFNKGRDWLDFKQKISGDEVRRFYAVQADLWRPDTDWFQLVSPNEPKLRTLYRGDMRPDVLLKNLIRASLYVDEIVLVDPFQNPWHLQPDYNPLENPDQYKSDTLKMVWLLRELAPWIESGFIVIVPEPSDFYPGLRKDTWGLAKARMAGAEIAPEDSEEARQAGKDDLRRTTLALPDDALLRLCTKAGMNLNDSEKAAYLAFARQQLHNDPLALEQPLTKGGQLNVFRVGGNLESALLLSRTRRAFIHTAHPARWREMMSVRDSASESVAAWADLLATFSGLKFGFLNGVDVGTAQQIRADGALTKFRDFLGRLVNAGTELRDLGDVAKCARVCAAELRGVYQLTAAELQTIAETFKRQNTGAAVLPGRLIPDFSPLSPQVGESTDRLAEEYVKLRGVAQPVSVFIEVAEAAQPTDGDSAAAQSA